MEQQTFQARVWTSRLADELKIPMLAGTTAEVDLVVDGFLRKVPAVEGVYLTYAGGKSRSYGLVEGEVPKMERMPSGSGMRRIDTALWFKTDIVYGGAKLGDVVVRFSGRAWEAFVKRLVRRLLLASFAILLLSSMLVYWIAKRMSRPLEELAFAAAKVAEGDFQVRIPVRGNDELANAVRQFNRMVTELAHKEAMRATLGRYLNPEVVERVFDAQGTLPPNRRQEVSVLFADMVGFTEFSETHPIEEVIEVLNAHFAVFQRIIAYFHGHVDKYIGDAVMAVFNHPVQNKAHARHAALAGLAISRVCSRGLGGRIRSPIAFRVGINCGMAIVGHIGSSERLEYTVIGDTVNVAARLSGLGKGGDVVVSLDTFERLGDGFRFKNLGRQDVKGVSKNIEIGVLEVGDPQIDRALDLAVEDALGHA